MRGAAARVTELVIPLTGGAYDGERVRFLVAAGELLSLAPVILRGGRGGPIERYALDGERLVYAPAAARGELARRVNGRTDMANEATAAPGRCMTFSGRKFTAAEPRAEDVRLVDVAHHLALICRFGGATSKFYSVAEHSCRVAGWLRREGASACVQLQGLLHDAAEAYCGDVPRPLKDAAFAARELRIGQAIGEALGYDLFADWDQVEPADDALLAIEGLMLMPDGWCELAGLPTPPFPDRGMVPQGWKWTYAEAEWLRVFLRLANELNLPRTAAWAGLE